MTTKQKIAVLLNLASVGAQIYASAICIMSRGWWAFQYYTMDSNIFAAITSIMLIFALLGKGKTSELVHNFRYYSTCCVTVTFIVVVTILVPLDGWHTLPNRLFQGTDLWLHSVGPLLNIFSFLFFEQEVVLNKKQTYYALIPTIIYAVIAIILNLLRVLDGPYVFLRIYNQGVLMTFVWLIVIGLMVFGIAFLLRFLNIKLISKSKNQ